MRYLDPASKSYKPEQTFDRIKKLTEGVPVEFAVTFVPYGRIWHKGETIRLQVSGQYLRDKGWFEGLQYEAENAGEQTLHTGGTFDAYLQIPVIPPKYKSFDYEVR